MFMVIKHLFLLTIQLLNDPVGALMLVFQREGAGALIIYQLLYGL